MSHSDKHWRYIAANPPPENTPIELLCADSTVHRVDWYDGYGHKKSGGLPNAGGIFWRPVSAPSHEPRTLSEFVRADETTRERIGAEVVAGAIERQNATPYELPKTSGVDPSRDARVPPMPHGYDWTWTLDQPEVSGWRWIAIRGTWASSTSPARIRP